MASSPVRAEDSSRGCEPAAGHPISRGGNSRGTVTILGRSGSKSAVDGPLVDAACCSEERQRFLGASRPPTIERCAERLGSGSSGGEWAGHSGHIACRKTPAMGDFRRNFLCCWVLRVNSLKLRHVYRSKQICAGDGSKNRSCARFYRIPPCEKPPHDCKLQKSISCPPESALAAFPATPGHGSSPPHQAHGSTGVNRRLPPQGR